jgi:hypothetical protein
MSGTIYDNNILFRATLNDIDDEDDLDFGELDTQAFNIQQDIDKIEPNREPRLELDYLGNNADIELIYRYITTWLDRDADMNDYLDKVENEIENGLNVIVTEREVLGYSKRQ